MTEAVAHILSEVEQLSVSERVELTDRLVESLASESQTSVKRAQLEEVRRRVTQAESGEVTLIPGTQVLEEIRRLITSACKAS